MVGYSQVGFIREAFLFSSDMVGLSAGGSHKPASVLRTVYAIPSLFRSHDRIAKLGCPVTEFPALIRKSSLHDSLRCCAKRARVDPSYRSSLNHDMRRTPSGSQGLASSNQKLSLGMLHEAGPMGLRRAVQLVLRFWCTRCGRLAYNVSFRRR